MPQSSDTNQSQSARKTYLFHSTTEAETETDSTISSLQKDKLRRWFLCESFEDSRMLLDGFALVKEMNYFRCGKWTIFDAEKSHFQIFKSKFQFDIEFIIDTGVSSIGLYNWSQFNISI